jgi:ornithine decarboxylase
MDKIIEGAELPELACGDYLYVENHGAYTLASSSSFNGFHVGKPLYVFTY